MSDVSESGQWVHRQTRSYREVRNGYTCFNEGDVLFAKITPCMENGKGCHAISLVGGVGFASTEFHVLRAKDCADAGFIFQWSIDLSLRRKAAAVMTGSAGQQRVPASFFNTFTVPCLPKPEQSKIAEVLSTVDSAIAQTEALIAKQQRIKTGLMQDLLTRGIDEHGQLRSEATHAFKDSPLGRIPVEWKVKTLDSVAEFVTSGARGWAKYYSEQGPIFLRIGNLTRKHINLRMDDIVHVQPPTSAEGTRTQVQQDDLLISVTADLGIIGVIPVNFGAGYVNQHIALARLNSANVSPRFVGWFLGGHQGRQQFDKLNESGAKAGLNLPTVRSLLFPSPELAEQAQIAAMLDSSTEALTRRMDTLRKLRHLKTALMQDLLTGKVRVTPLLEPAGEAIA
ncbi:MAG TPA: restriction endonuclease subunit S [Chiayiivirga sp.]|nr:restriction endonuclease subunit S [Chiayiivirga sp.]